MSTISSHQGISHGYLSAALAKLTNNRQLDIRSVSPIGTGQMAESYRVEFSEPISQSSNSAKSVVVKVPSQSPSSRAASKITRCYELETSFYSSLKSHVWVNAPECLHVWYDAVNDDFVLVLEDIVGATQGDQIAGASYQQAVSAIDELVKLHAPLWGSKSLGDFAWLPTHSGRTDNGGGELLRSVFPTFAERFEGKVSSEILLVGERLIANIEKYNAAFPKIVTVAHRDFRLDNLLFATRDGEIDVKVVDWQTVAALPGVSDLSYFIGASFDVDDRRKFEQDLVSCYSAGLGKNKVVLDSNELWSQYRLFSAAGYIMAIVASVLVKQTDRGDLMFAAMANRHGQQMIDLESEKLYV